MSSFVPVAPWLSWSNRQPIKNDNEGNVVRIMDIGVAEERHILQKALVA